MSKRTVTPFLGATTNRNAAFPDIEQIEFSVSQDPYSEYLREAWQRSERYTKSDIPSESGASIRGVGKEAYRPSRS